MENSKELLVEYSELGMWMRTYGNIRFAQLTLYFASTAGFVSTFLSDEIGTGSVARIALPVAASLISLYFFVLDYRSTEYWLKYRKRAVEIENVLGLGQYTSMAGESRSGVTATNATRTLLLSTTLAWLIVAIVHVVERLS